MNNKSTNRLINEKSPYLLQHAHNPVDWFPWCDAAFQKAERENKPIFLSIGYSTCHWCHVMERESFEDSGIAKMMNLSFINIKVDREERPDIDSVYMSVCQMMTGSGGWPMTIIMTPDKKPFYAGTYFPKESKWGRIGMTDLINQINDFWKNNRGKVNSSVQDIFNHLKESVNFKRTDTELSIDIFDKCYDILKGNYDEEYGGFGNAPKFPTPHNLSFLLRLNELNNVDTANAKFMVFHTLQKMYFGGIYDQLGFGFHRYSTDSKWLVPHFEKMLYDQALLINTYLEAKLITKESVYEMCVIETVEYAMRNMYSKKSGFFTAEDADSEGVEGKFYLWTNNEIEKILGKRESEMFCSIYNVYNAGNFTDEISKTKNGKNILHIGKSIPEICDDLQMSDIELARFVKRTKQSLFNARERRIKPAKDNKILTDWNAMMISSIVKAGFALGVEQFIIIAITTFDSLIDLMLNDDNSLSHRSCLGVSGIEGNLDDYAYMTDALLELYFATGNIEFVDIAINFTEYLNRHFLDTENGGYYFSPDTNKDLIIRKKEIYDGAIPSGNSVALQNLFRLHSLTGNNKYLKIAEKMIAAFAGEISKYPAGYCNFLNSLLFSFIGPVEIVIAGDVNDSNYDDMISVIAKTFLPTRVLIYKTGEYSNYHNILNPLISKMVKIDNLTTVYVCNNFNCKRPVTNYKDLKDLLDNVQLMNSKFRKDYKFKK